MTAVSVIVVTYRSAHVIGPCLRSLRDSVAGDLDCELVVVDNASTDDTVSEVEALWPEALVLVNDANVGYARAVNQGVRASSGHRVLLLNPDTFLHDGALQTLVGALDANGGIVAPLIEHRHGEIAILSAGRQPTVAAMAAHMSGFARCAPRGIRPFGHYLYLHQLEPELTKVDWVSGACFMTTRSLWDGLGGLSEQWFMYAEDVEFCHRASIHGESVSLVRAARIAHVVGGSDSGRSMSESSAWLLHLREHYRQSLARHSGGPVVWDVTVVVGFAARACVSSLLALRSNPGQTKDSRRRDASRFWGYARAVARQSRHDGS